jgi:SNF2 family DNA or RNA helicase
MDSLIALLQTHNITLHPHQIDGIKWMMDKEVAGTGAILADDPGLGKTLQLSSLIHTMPSDKPTLLIVPTSIVTQWKNVLDILFPSQVYLHYGDMRLNTFKAIAFRNFKVALTTPTTLLLTKSALSPLHWHRVVIDEAHLIKNHKTQLFNAISALHANYFWALTGTPIHNSLTDLKNLFAFVLNKPINLSDVQSLISSHLLRRDKSILHLPTIHISDQFITLDPQQDLEYLQFVTQLSLDFKRKISKLPSKHHIIWALVVLMRLRIASLKFKLSYLLQHLKSHSIIFYHYQKEADILLELINKHTSYTVDSISGSVDSAKRQFILTHKPDILLVQIKAGGVGLNLQHYTSAFITSPDWNPANEIQAIARIHRLGQLSTTSYTRLIVQSSISTPDTTILDKQSPKSKLYEMVNQVSMSGPCSPSNLPSLIHLVYSMIV